MTLLMMIISTTHHPSPSKFPAARPCEPRRAGSCADAVVAGCAENTNHQHQRDHQGVAGGSGGVVAQPPVRVYMIEGNAHRANAL